MGTAGENKEHLGRNIEKYREKKQEHLERKQTIGQKGDHMEANVKICREIWREILTSEEK